jgi:NADH dehydrogenase
VGGGFAGLYLARRLARRDVAVTLVDRTNHHLFQPLLYQAATAELSADDIAYPLRSVLSRASNIQVMLGRVVSADPAGRQVTLADGTSLEFDYLAIATGARHSYFGRPEWEQLAPGLKGLDDALEIRRRVLLAFERAERETDPVARQRHLTFVIVGGGPTGVEMAGALAEIRKYALRRDFRRIDSRDATVMLLEGGRRLLAAYPEKLSQRAKEVLRGLGVDVRTETMVTAIEPGFVVAADWRIPAETVIWAAGNQASPLVKTLGCPLDRQGRAIVGPDCSIPGFPNVLVLGDAAAFSHTPNGQPLPATSPVAIQMGHYAARLILGDRAGKARRPFHYFDKGQLAVIGRGQAVADLHAIKTGGFLAWLLWIFVHIAYLIGFRNRILVMFDWAWSYFTFQHGARLITEPWKPGDD